MASNRGGNIYIGIKGELDGFKKSLKDAKNEAKKQSGQITSSLDKVETKMKSISNVTKLFYGAIAGSTAALAVKQIVQITDKYTLLESRLKLVTASSEELASVQQKLFDISQNTRTVYSDTLEVYARIARATQSLGVSQADLLGITESLNQAVAVSGATSQEASAAMIQFSQALASSRLSGDELRSVLEQVPRVAQMIADGLDVNIGKLREMGKAGELTTEVVIKALQSQADTISEEYSQIEVTVGQAWVTLKNSIDKFIVTGNKAIGVNDALAESMRSFGLWLGENSDDFWSTWANMGVDNIDYVMRAWIEFKYFFKTLWLDLSSVLEQAIDNQLEAIADLIEGFAEVAAVAGQNELSTWLSEQADNLRSLSTASENYAEKLKQLISEKNKEIAVHNKTIAAMREEANQISEVNDETVDLTKTTKSLDSAMQDVLAKIEGNWSKAYMKEMKQRLKDYKDYVKTENKKVKATKKATKEREKLIQNYTDKYMELTLSSAEYYIYQLEQEKEAFEKTWDGNQETLDAFTKYYQAKMDVAAQDIKDLWDDTWDSVTNSLSEFISTGETDFDEILDAWKEMLADMLAEWLTYVGKLAFTDLFTDETVDWSSLFSSESGTFGSILSKAGDWFSDSSSSSSSSGGSSGLSTLSSLASLVSYGKSAYSYLFGSSEIGTIGSAESLGEGLTAAESLGEGYTGGYATYSAYNAAAVEGAAEGVGAETIAADAMAASSEGGAAAGSSAGGAAGGGVAAGAAVVALADIFFNDAEGMQTVAKFVSEDIPNYYKSGVKTMLGWFSDDVESTLKDIYTDTEGNIARVPSSDYYDTEEDYVSESTDYLNSRLETFMGMLESYQSSAEEAANVGDDELASQWENRAQDMIDQMSASWEMLDQVFGDGMAAMAEDLETTSESFGTFLESLSGVEVSSETAAEALDLATQAYNGSSEATSDLISLLESLGMSESEATIAASALISAVDGTVDANTSLSDSMDGVTDSTETASDTLSSFNDGLSDVASEAVSILSDMSDYADEASSIVDTISSYSESYKTGSSSSSSASGYSNGGIVNSLMIPGYAEGGNVLSLAKPPNEDGLAWMRFDERVLTKSDQSILERVLRGESIGGNITVQFPGQLNFVLDDGKKLKGHIEGVADALITKKNRSGALDTERVAY